MIFWLSEETLRECVKPSLLAKFDSEKKNIFDEFEDPQVLPHSRLKLEGNFSQGWFRSMKSYYLTKNDTKIVRAKGVTKTVQKELNSCHFQVCEKRPHYFTNYALRPTQAQEMTLGVYTKKNTSCLNFKRRLADNMNNTFPLQ